jgi:hypothetical protein
MLNQITNKENEMIDLDNYKQALGLETVEVHDVKLDVYYSYDDYFGFTLESVEDQVGTQNLLPILSDKMIAKIEAALVERLG